MFKDDFNLISSGTKINLTSKKNKFEISGEKAMKIKKYLLALFVISMASHVSAQDIDTDTAKMTMIVPLYASLTGLDDFALTSVDGENYSGSDVYSLVSNGKVRVSATTTNLVNNQSSVTPTISLDGGGTTFDTVAGVAHDNDAHVLTASAVVDSTDAGGSYTGTVTLTISTI